MREMGWQERQGEKEEEREREKEERIHTVTEYNSDVIVKRMRCRDSSEWRSLLSLPCTDNRTIVWLLRPRLDTSLLA